MKIIGITYEDGNVSDVHVTTDGTDRVVLAPVRHGHCKEWKDGYEYGLKQGRLDAINDIKDLALKVNYHYDYTNLSDDQKQELTDFLSMQVINVIGLIADNCC